ncbi:hypothetical protein IAU60_004810 [Kwoniella sp. DSM 27419]
MPIPPRPIPTHPRQRPGAAVPRKSLPSSSLDWRSEVALLAEIGSRSVPSRIASPSSGIKIIDRAQLGQAKAKAKDQDEATGAGSREVALDRLIEDGKGKRAKRATTATTLGFDFIANPTILALPDDTPVYTASAGMSTPSSLLSSSKALPAAIPAHLKTTVTQPTLGASPGSPLANTPVTPGLIAQAHSSVVPEESEDDDWEHIPALGEEDHSDTRSGAPEEEEDVIVLGELELEDELDRLTIEQKVDDARIGGKALSNRGRGSYAAALGRV